jgi:CHAT domain-containing protein
MRPVRGSELLRAALRELGDPLPAGHDTADAELRGRILVSLAYAEAEQGRIDHGWRLLAEAESLLPPRLRGLLLNQRALLYIRTGKDEAAIAQYDLSLAVLGEDGEAQDLARALLNRGNLHMTRGRLRPARADLRRCADVSARHGLARILPMAVHSLGYLDYLAGDLPAALRTYREVAGQYAAVKPGILPVLALDRARALIAAGLLAEADEQLAYALEQFRRHRLRQDHAEAQLARAEAALLAGDDAAARRWAARARHGFLRRDNHRWAAVAALVAMRARTARSMPSTARRAAAEAHDLADTLRDLGLAEYSRQAGLISVRALLAAGDVDAADREAGRHRPPQRTDRLETHLQWRLARAERAAAVGHSAEASRHLTAGMAALRRHRGQLGCLDLQTGAAVHGRDIAAAGLGAAVRSRAVAKVYRWSELSRAQALLLPPATPPDDPAAAAALEELRQVRNTVRDAELAGRPTGDLRVRAATLERTVREHSWSAAGKGGAAPIAPLAAARAELADAAIVVYLRDGRRLHALVVTARTVRLVSLGDYARAAEAVRRLRADLDAQAGRAMPARLAAAVAAATGRDAAAAAAALLDPLRSSLGDRDLVVVPTGTLGTAPWGVLPGCAGRPVTVAPSVTTWLAARHRLGADAAAGRRGPTVLVAGPGNDRGEDEIRAIAALHPGATVLTGAAATPAATAAALAGAGLAHLAAHGHHQQENALFSSLDLAGGPLMGYDLQRLAAVPAVVILASCDLGLADVRPGDETVGMTTALLGAGTSTVVAGVARIADETALPLMTRFHLALLHGRSPAAALADAVSTDPIAGLVCFGAG